MTTGTSEWRNSGVVYESLLELHPEVNINPASFTLTHGGTERRATGSHYTPPTILKEVLDFALEPAISRALDSDDPAAALLDLRVLDPAVGSGHFLIAAAHRLARALASVRTGELEATPDEVRRALRDVVARCIYGTDLNPMAVELCRVALWLETLQPGKPLSFLDHHIRVGNSLLGVPLGTTVVRNRAAVDSRRVQVDQSLADVQERLRFSSALEPSTPILRKELAALRKELSECEYDSWTDAIPDQAFKPSAGDDREVARKATAENRRGRRSGQLLLAPLLVDLPSDLVEIFRRIGAGAEESVAEVTIRAAEFEGVQRREEYRQLLALADTWTAAFFWPLVSGTAPVPTQGWFATLRSNPHALPQETVTTVESLTAERRFFHPEIAWPEVFTSDRGGFDVIMGNPPYLGGPDISGAFGEKVLNFLKTNHQANTGGRVDLAVYFLRRGFDLLREGGELGFITTNSVSDGDSLTAGLGAIVGTWGGEVANAIRSATWEGHAAVDVAIVHLHRGAWTSPKYLDGEIVEEIAPTLTAGVYVTAESLAANIGLVLKGANPLGTGFQLTPAEATRLLAVGPDYGKVIKPLFGTEDLTGAATSEPQRWIIDFGGRTLDEASGFPEALSIIERTVKPYREEVGTDGEYRVKRTAYRERWWQFAERSARLHAAIAGMERVLCMPETSKTMLPGYLPGRGVYLQSAFVFLEADDGMFGLLTSSLHWLWAARPGGASGMRTFPRYHQGRCFETFARPADISSVASVAHKLDSYRASVMAERSLGITKVYNLVNDPDEASEVIQTLRGLHVALDEAVAAAYGWQDLELRHGVHEHQRFEPRWLPAPPVQREIEKRLMALNRQRAGAGS